MSDSSIALKPVIEDPSHVTGPESLGPVIQEQRLLGRVVTQHVVARVLDPEADRLEPLAVQGHDALLAALAEHAKEPLGDVDALEVQSAQFGHAQSRAVEDLTDRAVEHGPLVLAPVVLEEIVELLAHHELGEAVRGARRQQTSRVVHLDVPALEQPGEVAAQGRAPTQDRTALVTAGGHEE